MARPEKAYRDVIVTVHAYRNGAFAIWEIAEKSGHRRAAVARIFQRLALMGYIRRYERGFAQRKYRVTVRWPQRSCKRVVEDYEIWRVAAR